MYGDPMHLARLASLEGALLALLRAAQDGDEDGPDEVVAHMNVEGLYVEYRRAGLPVGGEGV